MVSKRYIEPSDKIAVLLYRMQTTWAEYGLQTSLAQLKEHVYIHSTNILCSQYGLETLSNMFWN